MNLVLLLLTAQRSDYSQSPVDVRLGHTHQMFEQQIAIELHRL